MHTKAIRLVALPLIVYTLAALFITWPLVTQLSTHVAGAGYTDSYEYIRLGWWGKYALQHGLNPFYQGLLGYPDGFFSAVQWAQPLIYWPTALLGLLFSPVAALNLWLLLEIILSGLTAYWLCLTVLNDTAAQNKYGMTVAALLGGLVFMACPAIQGHLMAGHVNPLSNYALPVLALCLYRIVEKQGSIRTALIGAGALLVLALGNFTFPAFALLPLVLFGGGYLLLFRRGLLAHRIVLRNLVILFGAGGLLIVPFYLPLFGDLTATTRPAYLQETGWIRYSTDPLAFMAPSPFVPWFAPIVPAYSRTVLGTNSTEGTAYLGVIVLLLAVVAVWRQRQRAGLWLVIALGCMVFSLGPLLKWQDQPVTYQLGDYRSNVVLPWALFQNLPLLNGTRTPGRFNMTTGLALGVLAALGLGSGLIQVKRPTVQVAIGAVLAVLILGEYQLFFPFPTTPATLPDYFDKLASRSDVRAVFDVPWDDPLAQKVALYQQTAHHKPLIAGYISRTTPVDPAKLAVLSDIAVGKLPSVPGQIGVQAQDARAMLRANGADAVIYHLQLLDKDRVIPWATNAFGTPVYRDDQIAIFEIPQAGQPQSMPMTLAPSGWWRDQSGDKASNFPWLTGTSSLYVYTAAGVDQQWTLHLSPLLHPRAVQLTVDGQPYTARDWMIGTPTQQIDFWLRLEAGFHTLTFTLPDGCTHVPVAPVCLLYDTDPAMRTEAACALKDNVCVSLLLREVHVQDAGTMALQRRAIRLSHGMALNGFRAPEIGQAGQSLTVETDWIAAEKLPGDYHLFVHVLDQNGKLVAQADTDAGGRSSPTVTWSGPQTWIETLTLSLPHDLTAGRYSLFTGWYSYPDMTRLGVEGDGIHAADGLVYLRDIEIR